jgi:hypothetical protein
MSAALAPRQRITTRSWLALGLAAVTLLALAARLWQVTALPPGYWYDEAHKSLVALAIARGEQAPVYVTDNQGIEAGYFWLLAAWFRLVGPSFFGTRVLSALLGAAQIPLTFWTLSELYRPLPQARGVALAAAAWLSWLLWHVHWSRLGLETITVPLFAVALLGAQAWASRRQSPWAFALAGAVLGLSQYTNPGARMLVVQAVVSYLLLARGRWRWQLALGAAFGAAALLVYLPLGVFFLNNPEWFFNRITFTSEGARAGGLAAIVGNAVRTLGSLNLRGDVMVRHNLSMRPALDPVASVCMLAAGWALWAGRTHWRRHLALLAALGLGLAPMVFSDGAPGFGRTLGATPFLAALPALGLVAVATRLSNRMLAAGLVAGCLFVSASLNLYDYFVRYPRQTGLFDSFEIGQWTLINSAFAASREGTGYLILNEAGLAHPATQLAERLAGGDLRVINGQACLAYPATTTVPATLAVMNEWAPALENRFPAAGANLVLHEPEVYPYGTVIQLPPFSSSEVKLVPELARLGDSVALLDAELPLAPVVAGQTIIMVLRWHVLAPLPKSLNVFVHLGQPQSPPVSGADGPPCGEAYGTDRWHTDEIVEHQVSLAIPPDLAAGEYQVFAGLYNWATGERLTVVQGDGAEPDRVLIGRLTVGGQ